MSVNKIVSKINNEDLIVSFFAIFFLISVFFILPHGPYVGGDWTVPQFDIHYESFSSHYVWNSNSNFGQPSAESMASWHFRIIFDILRWLGFDSNLLSKVISILILLFVASSMYSYLRYIGFRVSISLIVATLYGFSPLTFNYLTMGWVTSIVAAGCIPLFVLFFTKLIRENSKLNVYILVFVVFISSMQIQSVIWLAIAAIYVLVVNREFLSLAFIFRAFKVGLILLSIVLPWVLTYLFARYGIASISDANIIVSSASIGADNSYGVARALLMWGGLYNASYEISFLSSFNGLSLILSFGIYYSIGFYLLTNNNKNNSQLMLALFAFMIPIIIFMYIQFRFYLVDIPLIGIFRQGSRFLVIYSFFLLVLFAYSIQHIRSKSWFLYLPLAFIILLFQLLPWVNGSLIEDKEKTYAQNLFLKTYKYSSDHLLLEEILDQKSDYRAIFFPTGSLQYIQQNNKFLGAYSSMVDVHSTMSSINGAISVAGDRFTPSNSLIQKYYSSIDKLAEYPPIYDKNIDIYIFRLDHKVNNATLGTNFVNFDNKIRRRAISELFPDEYFKILFSSKNLLVFERIKKNGIVSCLPENCSLSYSRENPSKFSINLNSETSTIVFRASQDSNWFLCSHENDLNKLSLFRKVFEPFYIYNNCIKPHPLESSLNFGNKYLKYGSLIKGNDSVDLIYLPQKIYESLLILSALFIALILVFDSILSFYSKYRNIKS
jgi:hypothetical protein